MMKKFTLLSAFLCLALSAGLMFSCSKDPIAEGENGETGTFKAVITFVEDETPKAQSNYAPPTGWAASIKSLYIMLYNSGTKQVKYAKEITAAEIASIAAGLNAPQLIWADVPTGTYDVVAVANAKQTVGDYYTNMVSTSVDGTAYTTATVDGISMNTTSVTGTAWTDNNVRGRTIDNQLRLFLNNGTMPTILVTATTAQTGADNYANRTTKTSPSEVFTAYGTTTITAGGTSSVTLGLQREVALMRLRMDISGSVDAALAASLANIDFTGTNGMLWYGNVPDQHVTFESGTTGWLEGLGGGFNKYWSVFIGDGSTTAFHNASSTGGSSVINGSDACSLWRDFVVFPNEASRGSVIASANTDGSTAQTNQQYTVVIGGKVKPGVTAYDESGNIVPSGTMLYWSALVKGLFTGNTIREVNLKIVKNGSVVPPGVVEEGTLEITLTSPTPWSTNIVSENHDI